MAKQIRDKTRAEFIAYLAANPDMRLMQAVRNFCMSYYEWKLGKNIGFILAAPYSNEADKLWAEPVDTFYWE